MLSTLLYHLSHTVICVLKRPKCLNISTRVYKKKKNIVRFRENSKQTVYTNESSLFMH